MKLFVCYLGGRAPGCRIELHDVAFAVGEDIADCYDALRAQWFGEPDGLHIDAYTALPWVDGHRVEVHPVPQTPESSPGLQLFFINLGGYDPGQFLELHRTGFYVAPDAATAKQRAKAAQGQGLATLHTDDALEVEDCLTVAAYLPGYRLILIPSPAPHALRFECGYHRLPPG